MIYFDNSASSFHKPKQVIKAVTDALTKFSANPGRSGHKQAIKTAMEVSLVREKVKNFVNAESDQNIIFTENCTDALNLAILGSVKEGGHVITSVNDHNSTLRPLHVLKNQNKIDLSIASPASDKMLTLADILPLVKNNTYLICLNALSNVDGMPADILNIGKFCAEKGIKFLVDGAQSVGHLPIDMQKMYIDMLAIAPHKGLYSPQGIGVLAISQRANLKPIRFGGSGTESFNLLYPSETPEMYECGTLSTPAILGLGAGIDFVNQNHNIIQNKIEDLTTYINYELGRISNVTSYTHPDNDFGVISFNILNKDSIEVADILDQKYNICTRGGFHCAPLKHKNLKTDITGTVRVSLSVFNTFSDAQKLIHAVSEISI